MEFTNSIEINIPRDIVADLWFNEYFRNGYLPNNKKKAKMYKKYYKIEQFEGNFGETDSVFVTKIKTRAMEDEVKTRILLNNLPQEIKMEATNTNAMILYHYIFEVIDNKTTKLTMETTYDFYDFSLKMSSKLSKIAYKKQLMSQLKEFKKDAEAYIKEFPWKLNT